jgi:hypothetical protein
VTIACLDAGLHEVSQRKEVEEMSFVGAVLKIGLGLIVLGVGASVLLVALAAKGGQVAHEELEQTFQH